MGISKCHNSTVLAVTLLQERGCYRSIFSHLMYYITSLYQYIITVYHLQTSLAMLITTNKLFETYLTRKWNKPIYVHWDCSVSNVCIIPCFLPVTKPCPDSKSDRDTIRGGKGLLCDQKKQKLNPLPPGPTRWGKGGIRAASCSTCSTLSFCTRRKRSPESGRGLPRATHLQSQKDIPTNLK